MDFLNSQGLDTSTNTTTELSTMDDGHGFEISMFKTADLSAEPLDADTFSSFNFLLSDPFDPNVLLDTNVNTFTLKNDGEVGVLASTENEIRNNQESVHESVHESGLGETEDVNSPASIIVGDGTIQSTELANSQLTSGLKFHSENPVLYRQSPDNCEVTTPERDAGAVHNKSLDLEEFTPKTTSIRLPSPDLPLIASSRLNLSQGSLEKNSAMHKSSMLMDSFVHPSPQPGRRRSQSMPPAEISFHRRVESGDVLDIGSPMVQRHHTTNYISRHHPYANARGNHVNVENHSPSRQPRSFPNPGGRSQPSLRKIHPRGSLTAPGSPVNHSNRDLVFNSGPENGIYVGGPERYINVSETHILGTAWQDFPVESRRLIDPIAIMQNYTRGVMSRLDLVVGTIRRDLLAFVEEPELEV
jgi:hypothetical protein